MQTLLFLLLFVKKLNRPRRRMLKFFASISEKISTDCSTTHFRINSIKERSKNKPDFKKLVKEK